MQTALILASLIVQVERSRLRGCSSMTLSRFTVNLAVASALLSPISRAEDGGDSPAAVACEHRPYSVLISVTNVKSNKGTITVDLHDDVPENFLKGAKKLDRVRVPAVPGETKVCVPVPKAGGYAIALY